MQLFLLHGMGGSPYDWEGVQKFLPSIALPVPNSSSPETCALAIADIIEKTAGGKFALAGYSMGGRLALLVAVELFARGLPPSRLILVSAGFGSADMQEKADRRRKDEDWAALAETNQKRFWEEWYGQALFSSYRSLPPSTKASWENLRLSMDIGSLTKQLRNLGPGNHEDLFPVLEGLTEKGLRVLYIVGELDKKYLELSRMAGEKSGARVSVITNAGHILPLEAPEELASEIRDFLK